MAKPRTRLKRPQAVGSVLGASFAAVPRAKNLVLVFRLQKMWPDIVGVELSRRTQPKRVQGKVLIIAAENPAWSQHLSMMKEKILEAIAEKSSFVFSDLRFVAETVLPVSVEEKVKPHTVDTHSKPEDLESLLSRLREKAIQLRNQLGKNRR